MLVDESIKETLIQQVNVGVGNLVLYAGVEKLL